MLKPQETPEPSGRGEQTRVAAQIQEAQERLIAVSYDKAATYTTVIIFGGYAAVFGLWQLTRDYLSKPQALWAALLVLVSLTSFVLFEVGKMVLVTRNIIAKTRVLGAPHVQGNPHRLLKSLKDIEATQQAVTLPFVIAWAIAVGVCVTGALGAAGILGYAFVTGLME